MWINRDFPAVAGVMLLALAAPATADQPLSAIDWLSQSVATPVAMPLPDTDLQEPAVTKDARPADVSVSTIGAPSDDAIGILPASVTGLPDTLWAGTPTTEIIALLQAERADVLPALQGLLYTILLAEVDPPADSDGTGRLFLARIDRLLDLGALDQAQAMLDLAGPNQPETFRRWFDVALLMGQEDAACDTMRAVPNVAPTIPARVFCLARGGDWNAAALTLRTSQALGFVTDEEDALLSRFLDPELYEGEPPLPAPSRASPLVWRMMEAIGEPMPTNMLPVAFAQADLRANIGWKARIEAGERLARTGALPANRLLGLYDEQKAAASGGVWDRISAVQAFEKAYLYGDNAGIAKTLPVAWQRMVEAELEVLFAELYGPGLSKLPLTDTTAALGFRVGLLSSNYEAIALVRKPDGSDEAFLIGIARGDLAGTTPPDGMGAAIRDGFAKPALPPELAGLIAEGRLGEAILRAIDRLTEGARGDLKRVTEGLATLRQVGLEDVARRTALELMLLERRG